MTAQPRKLEVFANPFFVILLGTSILFVLTALGYCVSMYILEPPSDASEDLHGAMSVSMARWLDRNAPRALAVEIVVMLISGLTAMATDHWFSPRKRKKA